MVYSPKMANLKDAVSTWALIARGGDNQVLGGLMMSFITSDKSDLEDAVQTTIQHVASAYPGWAMLCLVPGAWPSCPCWEAEETIAVRGKLDLL